MNIKQIQKSFQFIKPKYFKFSSTTNLIISLPDLKRRQISLPITSTITDFENEVRKMKHIDNIEIRAWDNSRVSKNSLIEDVLIKSNEPIFMKIDRMEWQELITENKEKEENIPSLIERIRKINKNKNLQESQLESVEERVLQIRKFYDNSLNDKLIDREKHNSISSLFSNYYSLKSELSKMTKEYDSFRKTSEKQSLAIILLGGTLFIAELLALYYGTFIILSWDITEPITYLVTCFNLVLVMLLKRKFGSLSAHDFFSNWFLRNKLRRKNFNVAKFESIKKVIEILKNKLN